MPYDGPPESRPIMVYFRTLLSCEQSLQSYESLSFGKACVLSRETDLLATSVMENKIVCSADLGDHLLLERLPGIAINVFMNLADCVLKTIKVDVCHVLLGQFDKLAPYESSVEHYVALLESVMNFDRQKGLDLAARLVEAKVPISRIFTLCEELGILGNCSFFVDALKENNRDDGPMQSRLLEALISAEPEVFICIFIVY